MTTSPDAAAAAATRLGLVGVGRERLLAEDGLAGLERGEGPASVQPVGQRVVDGVDGRVGEQGLVAVVDGRDPPLPREPFGPRPVAGRDRDHLDVGDLLGRFQKGARGDAGGAECPDAKRFHARRAYGEASEPCASMQRRPSSEEPARVLEEIRVVDCSSDIAGPYCTKLLADAGADVVKVESRSGDPLRSWGSGALFEFLNTSKRSVVAAPGDPNLDGAVRGRRRPRDRPGPRRRRRHRASGAPPRPGRGVDHAVRARRAVARVGGHRVHPAGLVRLDRLAGAARAAAARGRRAHRRMDGGHLRGGRHRRRAASGSTGRPRASTSTWRCSTPWP